MSEADFTDEVMKENQGYETLGPAYFAARNVSRKIMDEFEAENFKPLIEKASDEFRRALWASVEDHLLSDTEINISGSMYRMVDQCVEALLSGTQWAIDKYVLSNRYDQTAIREAITKNWSDEIKGKRIIDLEKEVAKLKEDLSYEKKRNRY